MTSPGFTLRKRLTVVAVLGIVGVLAAVEVPPRIAAQEAATVGEVRAMVPVPADHRAARIAANEVGTVADIRAVMTAQAGYQRVNSGFYDGDLTCLVDPQRCIPFYPANAPSFLDRDLADVANRWGYRRVFTAGGYPSLTPVAASPSSVTSYRYDAWPLTAGHTGVRAFAGDASGRICYTRDGTPVRHSSDGTLEPTCERLEDGELASSPGASNEAPLADALLVRKAGVEAGTWGTEESDEPFYSFVVTLENTSARPVVLVGVRTALLMPGIADAISDSTMGRNGPAIEPGDSVTLGRDALRGLAKARGLHFLVLAVRYGDSKDYRTNRRQMFVLKWPGARAGVVPRELTLAPEDEAARIRQQAFRLGGWWGVTGPEEKLAPG